MFELYLGLAPGEEPIDRLIDDAMADPIVGDCIVSAGLPTIACEPLTDETAGHGLWHRLRARWTDASEAGLPAASRFAALSSAGRPDAFGLQVGDDKKFRASTLG